MNSNEKNLKVTDDAKNRKFPVSTKETIQCSVHHRYDPCPVNATKGSQLSTKGYEKTNLDVSTAITKQLSGILIRKGPQIHESGRKFHANKRCTEQLDNAASKTVKNSRNRIKQENKHPKDLVSEKKSSASASRRQQSALKTNKDTVINDLRGKISKKTLCNINRNSSEPKAKEVPCKTILSLAERVTHRECKKKDCNGKREESSRSTSKELDKGKRKQENYYSKKYLEKVHTEEKIKLNSKKDCNNNAHNLEKTKETKKINAQQIVNVHKQTEHTKTVCNNIHGNIDGNGAARTRIFKSKKSSHVNKNPTNCEDSIYKKETNYPTNEFGTENFLPAETQNRDDQENKTNDSTKHDLEQDSIDTFWNIKDDNIISLYDGDFTKLKFGETFIKLDEERANSNFSSAESSKTSCKQTLPGRMKIDLSQENISTFTKNMEVCWDENVSTKDEKELIADSTKTSDHDCDEIKKSVTVSKIPSDSQGEITYCTNLINYEHHSDQPYSKRSNKQYENDLPDAAVKLTSIDKNQSAFNNDAKYNLMKALIQPATEIHDCKITDNNTNKLLMSARGSEYILTCQNEGLQNYYTNHSSHSSINKAIPIISSSLQKSQDNTSSLESCETWDPHTSAIYLRQSPGNTSEYIAMNLKMKGCKYTKKYRHFKHEEKNMCYSMAHCIKRIVANERKYQEFEKKENPEREEVKIIIDENSPKTSKIRIVNDRSSISIMCHSLGRTLSPRGINNAPASKAEFSGGESSGYKSFHNNSNTNNSDMSDQIEVQSKKQHKINHSTIITSFDPRSAHGHRYNPSTYHKTSVKPFCDPLYVDNPVNKYDGKIKEDPNSQQYVYDQDRKTQNREIKYLSYDTKNYLSTFTNYMDDYLPCEITAYQFEERNGSKIFQLNDKERIEKDLDNAELSIGKYLTNKNWDTKDEAPKEEESNERLDFVTDFTNAEDEVIVLKKPDNLKNESLEFVVSERLFDPDNLGVRTDSTDIAAVPAQHEIGTSLLDIKSKETTESSERSINASHVKFTVNHNGPAADVKSSNNNTKRYRSDTTFPHAPQVTTEDTFETSETYGNMYLGRSKNETKRSRDSNAVHELWTNKKSTIDSTDNDSQLSERSYCGKNDTKQYDANKFNIFRKLKSSESVKTINIPLDQVPKPPPSLLESTASSQSMIFPSAANTDASGSDIVTKSHAFAAPVLRTNSLPKSRADTAPINYTKKTHTDVISNEDIDHLRFQRNGSNSIAHKDTEKDTESSIGHQLGKRLLLQSQELHSAVAPPASALPPPYPFCCPLVPYMMQYWQNYQHPPPSSTVPHPGADWKSTVGMVGSEPPPPDMVPIPWFPPMMHMNNFPASSIMDSRITNNSRAKPPTEWPLTPRGYAPCLPCSKVPESHLGKTDSWIHEDDEPALVTSDNNQDGKKKKVSHKLFKIFRRKNRLEIDTLDEDDKKGRYQQRRADSRSNNVQMVENDEQDFDDHSIWESPDIAGIVTPEEIGRCFRRGFRADGLTLSGDNYLCARAASDTTSEHKDVFNFSDHDTPLDFLLALGFSVDEATAAIRDDEVRSRFKAALTEARIWVPHIATTQGTLLYLLAMKAKPKVMRYFLQLVESIVNKRITNAVKLDAYLKILEKVEEGYVSFVTLFGKDTGRDDEEHNVIVEKQRRRIFYTIYKYAESEAKEVDRALTTININLLHSLAARYRPAIGPHLRLLACYIGEGLLTKDVQVEAAVIYLSRLDSTYVQLEDFEKYCGLPLSERRRIEQIPKTVLTESSM